MSKKIKGHIVCKNPNLIKLSQVPTDIRPLYKDDGEYEKILDGFHAALGEYQTRLYAERARAVLIVFQGMDTSGKDGAIKHVMSGVNPQGCDVTSFKTPTNTELDHDFLWRINRALPARGMIGIFNRSYYEEILVTRVHSELIALQKVPMGSSRKKFWASRYHDMRNYEKYLSHQGYEIIKIFIHISKDEQKRRLLERFNNPDKLWKISESDIRERAYWKEYQKVYDECIRNTASKHCPWHIVPGNDKKNARLIISEILNQRLKEMNLEYPELKPVEKKKLKAMKKLLARD